MMQKQTNISVWRRYLPVALLGVFVFGLLTFLILLQSSQIWRSFAVDSASDTLTLYALISLNFFALIIFGFILLRSVLKLIRERRALKLGSKLKTKLLVYFVAISLLPIAAMATFSYLFLNRALEKWFSRLPEIVIQEAKQVQQNALENQIRAFEEKAGIFAVFIASQNEINEPAIREILERGNFAAVEIAASNNVVLARLEKDLPAAQRLELKEILEKTRASDAGNLADGIGFDAKILIAPDNRILRFVSHFNDPRNVSFEISNSPVEFERLKNQQTDVRRLGFSTLSLLTFLLIFAASWVAFHLGRSLTQPIQALAIASGEITRGNFAYRIDAPAEDELLLLIQSFNAMTAQLGENRQKLEERRDYIEIVLQSLSTGVISLDENNHITTINAAAVEMLRLPPSSEFLSEILQKDDLAILEKLLSRARRLGKAAEQTVLLRQNSGIHHTGSDDGLPVALTATALRGEYGKTRGAVLVIEDLSELLAAQRAAAWQEVAKRMAHEIKNPLTPIQLAAERIAKRFQVSGPWFQISNGNLKPEAMNLKLETVVTDSTTTILQEVASLKAMVDEFSNFARLPEARLETENLNEIVRQTISLYEDRLRGARFKVNLAENLPDAMLDAEQLRRVLVNLIENALESFDENQSDKTISIKTNSDFERDLLRLELADNGRGIAQNDFAKLFQPYFSTKNRGTGLGLAIVQRIITEHGGKIRAVPNHPNGAKFIIELPKT